MRFKERTILYLAGAVLFGAAFSLTFLWLGPGDEPSREQAPLSGVALAPGAEAVVHYLLGDGHIATTDVFALPDDLVGLTLQEFRTARPEWSVVSFAPERVVVSLPCEPIETTSGFISAKDGKVAIFRGRPEGCHEVQEITDIDAAVLGANAHQSVDSAIPFDDPSELPFILEGLKGHTL